MMYQRLRQWERGVAVLCVLCFGLVMEAASAEVSVEISGSGRRQIKIAIPDFSLRGEGLDGLQSELSPVLQNDLHISGFFDSLKESAALVDAFHVADLNAGTIQFQEWESLGARLLVNGIYEFTGQTVLIECRVYDTLGGDLILGKRYQGERRQVRDIMHRFADEIILKMTGERGMSSSKVVFVSKRSGSTELYRVDFDGKNLTKLTNDSSLVMAPAVSPDGKKIAYTSYRENNPDLVILSLETGQSEMAVMFPGLNFAPSWASDNQTIALTLSKDGNPELYLVDTLSKQHTRLTRNRWNDVSASWSPDNAELVFTADSIGAPQLYIVESSGGSPRRLTFKGAYNVSPDWSPTGEQIAFASSMDGNFNIYTILRNGDRLQQLTIHSGDNEDPAWSPDGRYIAFQSNREGASNIYIMNADGTNQRRLTEGQGADLSPDWIP
ncbi:Tol-Pal system beta propeller repeat protein TolB [candidate division KSB3 bacterium]|uniref:Tol-Pal system beta propeller repeat protein TolB n=1 Tax=candidate division KSB3 bacterium TaxID=2044937 RepID=A0A2G6EES0_9BACT|nr:MAG: Tol-Pal system beta propeller repeat protein TolB [candidate division KSB3 bacterium]PIE31064.1 MAG: Tol-Pal system beta propeller repeat protein TolB [candidate division KSB3 bacterium]